MEEQEVHVRTRSELAPAVSTQCEDGALAQPLLCRATRALGRFLADSADQCVHDIRAGGCHFDSTEAESVTGPEPLTFESQKLPTLFDLMGAGAAERFRISQCARVAENPIHAARHGCNPRTTPSAEAGSLGRRLRH